MSWLVPSRWMLLPLETALETWRWKTDDLAERQAAEIDEDDRRG